VTTKASSYKARSSFSQKCLTAKGGESFNIEDNSGKMFRGHHLDGSIAELFHSVASSPIIHHDYFSLDKSAVKHVRPQHSDDIHSSHSPSHSLTRTDPRVQSIATSTGSYQCILYQRPVPVVAWSKAWVCGSSLAEIAGSNPARSMDVCLL
jgi:hypothetical protein